MADRQGGGDDWNDPLADIDFEEFELGEPGSQSDQDPVAGYAPQPPALITCPSCGAAQPATNLHCEQCGARLSKAPLPVAPRPLANVTAGTRALTVILSVLAGVVVLALGFQIFRSGDDDAADPGAAAAGDNGADGSPADGVTATTLLALDIITPIKIECSSQYNDHSLTCDNLIDGDDTTVWNDASLMGAGARFTITFAQPVALQQVTFTNVLDDTNFQRNYRIDGISIVADDLRGLPMVGSIPNENTRDHVVETRTLGTTELVIEVVSVFPSQALGNVAFDELALAEIEFWGRLVETTDPVGTTSTTNSG